MNIQSNTNSVNPNPRFTGIFIPVEILDLDLSSTEQMLLAWVDALYCPDHHGCFASNEYLANKLKIKENTLRVLIYKLRDMGLIEQVSFNGRVRVIRACKENWFKNETPPQAECDLNHRQTVIKITGRPLLKSQSLIYRDKRLDKSIENTPLTPKVLNPERPTSSAREGGSLKPLKKFGDFVEISEDDYQKLKALSPHIDQIIEEMNDWIGAKGRNPYKSFFHALKQWIRKRETDNIKPVKPKSFTLCSDEKKTREIAQKLRENAI